MEGFPSVLVIFNVCAATFPRFASVAGLAWVVGRIMYQIGYGSVGPKGRTTGALISEFSALALVLSKDILFNRKLLGSCFGLYKEYTALI